MTRYLVFALLISTLVLCAGDSWSSKDPATWTDKEVQQVLNKSPWAKEAVADFNPERMGGMGGPGSGQGQGMGGPGGGEGGQMEPPKLTVRWLSGTPVLAALAKSSSGLDPKATAEWAKDFYVVAVSGMRMGPRGGRRRGNGEEGKERQQPDAERMKEMRARMQERMMKSTSLTVKGKDAIAPARVEMVESEQGRISVFLFPRTSAIAAGDKEVSFETAMGPLEIKTKFVLKDMQYQGKLSL